MEVRDGVASTVSPKEAKGGLYWYEKKSFGDFILRLEFKIDTETSNSGILVRFPDPQGDYDAAAGKAYEIDIYGSKTGTIVFPPHRERPSVSEPLHPGEWNECELIDTLNERDKALVRAGYTAAQAQANIEVTNQALEARRRFTRWPTYFREKDQREELRKQKENGAALVNQRPVLEWAARGAQIRRIVDGLYAQFREAARRAPAGK